MIPLEINLLPLRVENFVEQKNSDHLRANQDLHEETREQAQVWMISYQQRMAQYYIFWVKAKLFWPNDLVLRKAKVSQIGEQGKLVSNWEGPYQMDGVETISLQASASLWHLGTVNLELQQFKGLLLVRLDDCIRNYIR